MKQLYFIRHGETEFNRSHKWTGSTDVSLNDKGHQQAQAAGKKLSQQGLAVDIIVSSPLQRAHQTAQHVAEALNYPIDKIQLDDRLIERDFGSLEGKRQLVAATKYMFDESAIDHHDGVEKVVDLQQRVNDLLEHLNSLPHDTIVVVGHGASGRALRRAINNEPVTHRGSGFENAEIVRLI